jgi:hypothetical protein
VTSIAVERKTRLSKAQMEGLADLISDFFNGIGHRETNSAQSFLVRSTFAEVKTVRFEPARLSPNMLVSSPI